VCFCAFVSSVWVYAVVLGIECVSSGIAVARVVIVVLASIVSYHSGTER
jgi:hypothetical protein